MVLTRAQEQRFSRWEEKIDQRFSRLEEMIAALGVSRKQNQADQRESFTKPQVIQESDDRSPLDRYSPSSQKVESEVATDPIETEHELVSQVVDSFPDVLLVHKVDSHVMEVEELSQKSTSGNGENVAHQLFDQMPLRIASKEKRRKSLKAWKFKFKPTSKRSKLRDDVFSFVEETAWFKKDPKETIWDCVKRELKETMAACGKNGGGSLLECIDEESFGDDRPREVIAELNSYTGLTHLDKSDFRRFDGDKIKEWLFKVEEFFSIDFTSMELMVKLASSHFEGDATNWHQSLVQSGQFGQLLTDADYVQQDEFEQVVNHTPFSVVKFGKYKACDALLLLLPSDERFQIKHKWRFRLSHSFSEMKQRVLVSVRKSFGYLMETHGSQYKGLGCVVEKKKLRNVEDGVKQDKDRFSGDVGAKVFMASEELRLLQDVFEMVKELPLKTSLVSPQVMLQTSVSAISEFSDYNNKRMKGTHDEGSLFTLIDSDSTQNFIYPKIAEKLGCEMEILLNHYMVLLLTPVAYAIQFLGGVGMDKKLFHLSLRNHRVWDPGG